MPLNLQDFLSELRSSGVHPQNRFSVNITPPKGSGGGSTGGLSLGSILGNIVGAVIGGGNNGNSTATGLDSRRMGLRAAHCVFPGRTNMTKSDIVRQGWGAIDKVGGNTLYTDVPVSFIVDNKYNLAKAFHDWMSLINPADRTRSKGYSVGYKDDYASTIKIQQFNQRNQLTAQCTLHDAFPISVSDTQLGWDMNDACTVLPVTFTYTDYTIE